MSRFKSCYIKWPHVKLIPLLLSLSYILNKTNDSFIHTNNDLTSQHNLHSTQLLISINKQFTKGPFCITRLTEYYFNSWHYKLILPMSPFHCNLYLTPEELFCNRTDSGKGVTCSSIFGNTITRHKQSIVLLQFTYQLWVI